MKNSPESVAKSENDSAMFRNVAVSFAAALVDESPDALIALAADGKVLFWNRGACDMFGFSLEDAGGWSLDQMVIPADRRDEAEGAIKQVLNTGSALFETVRKRKDRSLVNVEVSMHPVRDAEGGIRFIAMNHTDVTQLKHLRDDRVAELRFQALLEAAPDAMVMVGKDGQIVLVNGQTEKMFGYRREELLGQPIEILVPEKFRGAHPKHRQGYFGDPRTRAMGTGIELFGRRKDGSEFPAEISLSPMETADGRYATAAIRDINDRAKIEAKFRGLLEAAPDAMVIVNRRGRIVLINSQTEKLFGYPRAELIGQTVEILVPERFRGRHPGHHRAQASRGQVSRVPRSGPGRDRDRQPERQHRADQRPDGKALWLCP